MNEKLSTGARLHLDVKRLEVPKIKRQRTVMSPFKGTKQMPEIPLPPVDIVVPPALINVTSICIIFHKEQGRPSPKVFFGAGVVGL